jgi:hypothetical protein
VIYKLKKKNIYEVYVIIKIRNKTNNKVSKRKLSLLDFILINIYRLFLIILNRAQYFFKIINNYIKKS